MKFSVLLFESNSFQVPKAYIATTNGMIALLWYKLKFSQSVERAMMQYANKQHLIGRGNRIRDAHMFSNMCSFLPFANCQYLASMMIRGENENLVLILPSFICVGYLDNW